MPTNPRSLVLLAALCLAGSSRAAAPHLGQVPDDTPKLEQHHPSAEAAATLKTQGFVISRKPAIPSFHLGYTGLFKAHQPLYFTADSFLYAFHRSYDRLLKDVERGALLQELATLLAELRGALAKDASASPAARTEVDLFLAVAESLRTGASVPPVAGADAAEVARWVARAQAEARQGMDAYDLMREGLTPAEASQVSAPVSADERVYGEWPLKGIARLDLSVLKPRGHYAGNAQLAGYFKAMMWLGRAELRIVDYDDAQRPIVNRTALKAAVLLDALFTPRAEQAWTRIDEVSRAFVGPSDSMSFAGLRRAARAHGLPGPSGLLRLRDAELIAALGPEANGRILSRLARPPKPGQQPIEFLVLGQRYAFDSEVLSAVSYGRLEQKRMMPSPLDVGWAALRNPAALSLLAPELQRHRYRDALEAVASRGEQAGAELWEGSLYHLWLRALRKLSPDAARDVGLPAPLRSEAWQRRMLNTQLASWTELRHDTLLYAKQSTSGMAACEFPQAYVDPYPEFFRSFELIASRGQALLAQLRFATPKDAQRMRSYFERLGETAARLREMAEREREGKALTAAQLEFMNHAVSVDGKNAICTTHWEGTGWYGDLFYVRDDALKHEPVIADVHTQPTDALGSAVGKVLHAATGRPRMMTVTLDLGRGPQAFRGFVSSYFEVTTDNFERLSDSEWSPKVEFGAPEDLPWLGGILAP